MRTVGAHALGFSALVTLSLSSCAPHHGGGGSGGEAGEGGSGGATAGSAGTDAGGSSAAGSSAAGSGGAATGGTGTAGSGGSSGSASPGSEPIIGCPAPAWPEEGLYFIVPRSGEAETKLQFFSPQSISGDGRVVGGGTRDPESDNPRPVPALFSLEDGATLLPRLEGGLSNEGFTQRLSCDGSVALAYDLFGGSLHRAESGHAPAIMYNVPHDTLAMDPSGTIVVDGSIYADDPLTGPRVWTAATGAVYWPELGGSKLHHVSPDGTFIGSDFEALFRYDRATGVKQPIGMAPLGYPPSLVVAASGKAWIQNADEHFDSFLLWQPPAQPRSVTCPDGCYPRELSSNGEVALLDVHYDQSQAPTSLVWTKRRGWLDLAALFTQSGLDVQSGRKLHAIGMSDDARVFAGYAFNPSVLGDQDFFYGVLPATAYD